MHQKEFDIWNRKKKSIQEGDKLPYFHEREVWFFSGWINVGVEQNGKWIDFARPIIVVKKFNKHSFWWIPLSSQEKTGKVYYSFNFTWEKMSYSNISQLKLSSSKRLIRKIGMVSKEDFLALKQKIKSLIDEQ